MDPYAPPTRQQITKEILLEMSPHHTNEEIAEHLGVSVEAVRNYKSRWKIKGKNKKPGPERKNA